MISATMWCKARSSLLNEIAEKLLEVRGEDGKPVIDRVDLVEELYPNFRWYLFDGREIYTAAFTLFGPLKVAVFVGQAYLVLDDPDHVARFSKQFDQLIRKAVFQPHEIRSFIQDCLSKLDECG